ncbi:hypothetical protein PENSPDRAFT_645483 [Peniophora sp. CONT]|nr:hypothetical protein PENSPDRAFT_645483 [Peniophora sp. CONT]
MLSVKLARGLRKKVSGLFTRSSSEHDEDVSSDAKSGEPHNSIIGPSFAQSLPEDVICEIYYALAAVDPPKYAGPLHALDRELQYLEPEGWDTDIHPTWTGPRAVSWNLDQVTLKRRSLYSPSGSYGWIILTHVNSSFRRVGLNLAVLWGETIHLFPAKAALDTIKARARAAPLSFDFGSLHGSLSAPESVYLHLAVENIARVGALVTGWSTRRPPLASARWLDVLSFTRLNCLKFLHIDGANVVGLRHAPIPTSIPENERYIDAPILLSLTIKSTQFMRFRAPFLRSLVLGQNEGGVSSASILRALESTPLLEELEISYSLADAAHDPGQAIVNLPHLTTARFYDSLEDIANLWRHIRAPLTCLLVVHLVHAGFLMLGEEPVRNGELLIAVLRERLGDPSISAFSFTYSRGGCAIALATSQPDSMSPPLIRTSVIMRYDNVIRHFFSIPRLLSSFVTEMTVENITFFHASPCPSRNLLGRADADFSVEDVYDIVSRFTCLSIISLSWIMRRYQAFLESLGTVTSGIGHILPTALPNVPTLILTSVDEEDKLISLDLEEGGLKGSIEHRYRDLTRVLSERADAGYRFTRLILRGVKQSESELLQADLRGVTAMRSLVDYLEDERSISAK